MQSRDERYKVMKIYRDNNQEKVKTWNKKSREKAKFTHRGWITKVYGRMKRSSETRKNCPLDFSKEEFTIWIKENKVFKKLHKDWVDSCFDKKLVPSVDRIDDYGGYSFDNIQLMTWEENNKKGRLSKKNREQCGTMARNKWSKKVNQIKDGKIVKTWNSQTEASNYFGIDRGNISKVCKDKQKTAAGFQWEYAHAS